MNPTTNLIIKIFNPSDPYLYTVTLSTGQLVTGFATLQQLDGWLKLNDGGFTSGPEEVQPDVYQRKAQISTPAYNRMLKAQVWAEKKAA
jgi:hypothetical protein